MSAGTPGKQHRSATRGSHRFSSLKPRFKPAITLGFEFNLQRIRMQYRVNLIPKYINETDGKVFLYIENNCFALATEVVHRNSCGIFSSANMREHLLVARIQKFIVAIAKF